MDPQGIEMTGLSVVFDTAARRVTAVTDIDQSVPHSSFVSIVGPSGCGKSTLLAVVAGLQKDLDQRYARAGELASALRAVQVAS